VAAIVQAHGGRVELTTAPGAGTLFRVVLPAKVDDDGTDDGVDALADVEEEPSLDDLTDDVTVVAEHPDQHRGDGTDSLPERAHAGVDSQLTPSGS
jgi:hypothetical protein